MPRGEFASIDDLPPEKADPIVARVNPATISVQLPDGRSTTAFLVDRRGWAITNYRFVAGARSATAVYGPRAQTPVQGVVAANPRCDLVLLCVGLVDEEPAIAMLAAAPYETPEIVLCGSTPTPDRFTVSIAQTLAPISGVEARELMNSEERADLFAQRGYGSQTLWVRTTVNIQEGRLGAPIIDTQSRVVGVATWSSPRDRTVSCAVSVVEIHELLRRAGDKIYPLSALDGKTLLPK